MTQLPATHQREVVRPAATPVPMPALAMPKLSLPGPLHPGTSLARLAGPPAPGSSAEKRDHAITSRVVAQRSPHGDAWARAMDAQGGTLLWKQLAAQVAGDEPTAQALVGAALAAASTQSGIGKRQWDRPRPFQVDPSISVIGRTPSGENWSYPSGHAARAYAGARVIAALDPSIAEAAYSLAREVAVSRIYAGVHYASDVIAGARLGTHLADSVLARWRDGTIAGDATRQAGSAVAA